MNKYRIALLSMLVISTVFCISFIFNIQFPEAHTADKDGGITTEARITEETSEEAITSMFSYNVDDTDEQKDDTSATEDNNDSNDNNDGENLDKAEEAGASIMTLQASPVESLTAATIASISDNEYTALALDAEGAKALEADTTAKDTDKTDETAAKDNSEDALSSDSPEDSEGADNSEDEDEAYDLKKYAGYLEEQYKAAYEYLEKMEREALEAKYSNIGISVAKEYVNIRKKATTDSESLGKLYRNSACTILEVLDGWYYVVSGSVTGYVKAEYIKTGIPAEELIEKYGTQKIRVTANGLNVRKEPSTESKRLTVIYMNEKYPVLEKLDGWYKIKVDDENIDGYVKNDHVEMIVTFKEAVSKQEEARLLELQAEERAKKETAIKYRSDVKYTDDELMLLACLVHAEAGTQSYEGKLAVANIVINRVKSSKYPNTIREVIYQKGQFSVAASGSLQKQLDNYKNFKNTSQKLSIKAAKDALEGANNIGNRLYFHSYKAALKKGYTKKANCVKIEDHLFW